MSKSVATRSTGGGAAAEREPATLLGAWTETGAASVSCSPPALVGRAACWCCRFAMRLLTPRSSGAPADLVRRMRRP